MRKRAFAKDGEPAAGAVDGGLLLGYARVSKGDEQSNALQARALRAAGCRRIFEEQASGGRWDRPELHRLLDQLRAGDTVVVWKLDRLSRSLKDVLHLMERIARAGAGFRSLTESIDTTTPAGRMMMQMVGAFAEFERAMIRERTSAGLAAAQAEGRVGGRRKKLDAAKRREIAESVISGRKSGAEMARLYSISQPTVSRIVAQHRMAAGPRVGSGAGAGQRGGARNADLEEATREEGPVEPGAAAVAPALPDRRAMERFLAALGGGRGGDDPTEKAQDVMYEAWERTTSGSRIALARKALAISPLCADAYVLLAEEAARSVEEARELYAKGVEAGELALGPEGFAEYAGHFWGFLETRPYMRARAGLAGALLKLGDVEGAIGHFRDMLRLNPGDNQGIRYLLAGCLLRRGDDGALKELLAAYPDEGSPFWLYTRALLAFREGGEGDEQAAALAREAWAANEHVPAILAGTQPPVPSAGGFIALGGPDEATEYVAECGPVWHRTPGAVAWLTKTVATMPPKRRARPPRPDRR